MPRKKLPRGFIYARIGVGIFDDPQLAEAGWIGVMLHVRAIAYSREHMTDGRVPHRILARWMAEIMAECQAGAGAVDALVASGIWRDDGEAVFVVDYATYQETKAEIEAQSEAGSHAVSQRHDRVTRTSRTHDDYVNCNQTETETEKTLVVHAGQVVDASALLIDDYVATDTIGKALREIGSDADEASERTIRRFVKRHRMSQYEVEQARSRISATPRGVNRAAYFVGALKLIVQERAPIERVGGTP